MTTTVETVTPDQILHALHEAREDGDTRGMFIAHEAWRELGNGNRAHEHVAAAVAMIQAAESRDAKAWLARGFREREKAAAAAKK